MPRWFTGIEIPEGISTRLAMIKARVNGARWVDKENYHITLRFAGDIPDSQAKDFAQALEEIDAEPFNLTLEGLGSFGSKKPRSIWVRVGDSEPLKMLHAAHERAARSAGLAPESRKFVPHVTIAWLKGVPSEFVASFIEEHGGPVKESFEVKRFVIYSAKPSKGGGPYLVEEAYNLD